MDDLDDENVETKLRPRVVAAPVIQPPPEEPMSDGNDVFPVPFAKFAATLMGTHDEIWIGHLRTKHRHENHLMTEWASILEQYRHEPAHPMADGYKG